MQCYLQNDKTKIKPTSVFLGGWKYNLNMNQFQNTFKELVVCCGVDPDRWYPAQSSSFPATQQLCENWAPRPIRWVVSRHQKLMSPVLLTPLIGSEALNNEGHTHIMVGHTASYRQRRGCWSHPPGVWRSSRQWGRPTGRRWWTFSKKDVPFILGPPCCKGRAEFPRHLLSWRAPLGEHSGIENDAFTLMGALVEK